MNLLVAFEAIYTTRSVSRAAQRCFVSQSAMSHTLQRMRALFDDPLFDRVSGKMEPTQRAHDISPLVSSLLASIKNDLLSKNVFDPKVFSGVWNIGLTDYAEQLFAPVIYDMVKHHAPLAQVSFFNVNRDNYISVVDKQRLDVVIGSIDYPNRRFISERLYTEQHVCLFDPESVIVKGELTLLAFAEIEHALVSPDGRLESRLDRQLAQLGFQRRVGVASRNFLTVRRLLVGRKLLCIVPKRFAEMDIDHYGLSTAPTPIDVADFDIQLLYLKAFEHEEKNRWIRQLIKQVVC
nr:LysR family transcriptional regulator [Vibrio ostreicida]